MGVPVDPLTLRLPPWLVDRFDLPRVSAEAGSYTRSEAYRLLERFAMSGPEQAFVQTVLARRTNLWLYRCNQRAARRRSSKPAKKFAQEVYITSLL